MTFTLFMTILAGAAAASVLLTQAIKKVYENENKPYSSNVIALVIAIVLGGGTTAVVYMLMGVPWTVNNIICLVIMMAVVWVGAMVGYDKVLQLILQMKDIKKSGE